MLLGRIRTPVTVTSLEFYLREGGDRRPDRFPGIQLEFSVTVLVAVVSWKPRLAEAGHAILTAMGLTLPFCRSPASLRTEHEHLRAPAIGA